MSERRVEVETRTLADAIDTLRRFVDEYPTLRGLDPEFVYTIRVGSEPTCLRLSDLRLIVEHFGGGAS